MNGSARAMRIAPGGTSLGSAPAQVSVQARIGSPNAFESPLSGTRAAAFVWRFMSRSSFAVDDGNGREMVSLLSPLGTRQWGGSLELVVEGGHRIHVPWGGLSLVPSGDDPGIPLDRDLPPEVARPLDDGGLMLVSETAFATSDDVVAEGWLARIEPSVPFRSVGDSVWAPLAFRDDLGSITLAQLFDRNTALHPWPRRLIRGARHAFSRIGKVLTWALDSDF